MQLFDFRVQVRERERQRQRRKGQVKRFIDRLLAEQDGL